MSLWSLPTSARIGGREYPIHADYRDIMEIFRYLDDPDKPEFIRWRIAIALFYEGEIPQEHFQEAVTYFSEFVSCGEQSGKPGPKLLDWEQEYYRKNKERVDLKKRHSAEELAEQDRLKQLLGE